MADCLGQQDDRLLTGLSDNEDSAILTFPAGKALVQTVDFFTPIVNDPYWFGQIAAANALSDVYAMGGTPYSAMNIVCFPIKKFPKEMLREILHGGMDKIREAGAVLAGGHSVEDEETKYGLAVSGIVDPDRFSSNKGLRPGDTLILTKPIGTGVLATGLKADWDGADRFEELLYRWAGMLNKAGGEVITELGLIGATDVTGFGLGGHLLEMAQASKVRVALSLADIPFIPEAVELAGMGMIPAGSFANKNFCSSQVHVAEGCDPLLVDLVFDAQTSGGLILSVPPDKVNRAVAMLDTSDALAAKIGRVQPAEPDRSMLSLLPEITL